MKSLPALVIVCFLSTSCGAGREPAFSTAPAEAAAKALGRDFAPRPPLTELQRAEAALATAQADPKPGPSWSTKEFELNYLKAIVEGEKKNASPAGQAFWKEVDRKRSVQRADPVESNESLLTVPAGKFTTAQIEVARNDIEFTKSITKWEESSTGVYITFRSGNYNPDRIQLYRRAEMIVIGDQASTGKIRYLTFYDPTNKKVATFSPAFGLKLIE